MMLLLFNRETERVLIASPVSLDPAHFMLRLGPVSYTHLDVYKRQLRAWTRHSPFAT